VTESRDELYQRALRVIPGGVSSPVRAFNAVGGTPFFVERAEGAYLTDTEGNRYLDYVQSWGASILGHADPAIVDAVQRAAATGTSFGAPTAREVELAEVIVEWVPSVDKVRLVSSGTEATMTAVRIARGATRRNKLLKFAGCYHGHLDSLLVAAGSGVATLGLPGSAGVTPGAVGDTIVVPYNDVEALDAAFRAHGDELAAALVEPVAANMGLVPPEIGFLEHLAQRCKEHGALFVCDEVITGFRLGPAGAQGRFDLTPDLSIFGKVIGGGLPLAAVGGRVDLMDHLAPIGDVYQAGTLSGNPLATAAGLAALRQLGPDRYDELEARVAGFGPALHDAIAGAGLAAQVQVEGTLSGLFFSESPVRSYDDARAGDHKTYARFFHAMLDRGVFLAPSSYEVMFVSLAHSDTDLARTVELAGDAAHEVVSSAATNRG
jgi:glutamate-1-semialdehyde 2,1-aminomutase